MLKAFLLSTLAVASLSVPFAVDKTQVLTDWIEVGDMRIQYAAFVVDFNQPIFFQNATGGLFPAGNSMNATSPNPEIPGSIVMGFGSSFLRCPNSNFNNRSSILDFNAMQDGPPFGLLTAPSVEEPVAAFINQFARGLKSYELPKPNRYVAVTLFGWPASPAEDPVQAFSNCTLQFGFAPPPGLPTEAALMLHNITDNAGNVFSGNVTIQRTPSFAQCTFQGVEALLKSLDNILANTDLATGNGGDSLQLTVASWQSRSAFKGCEALLKSFFTQINATKTITSSSCNYPYGTLEWAADPCCNYDARREKCCVPRSQNITVQTVGNLTNNFNTCRHPGAIKGLLSTFTSWKSKIDSLPQPDISSQYETLVKFRQECYNSLWNQDCSVHSDCYSGRCNSNSGKCEVPWGKEYTVLIPCFVERMSKEMKVEFQSLLELPVKYTTPDQEKQVLAQAILNNYTIMDCVGPQSQEYRRRWQGSRRDENGDWVPDIVPGNMTGCLSEMACSYQQWPPLNQTQCLDSSEALKHPYFCASITGNTASWPQSMWSQCFADVWGVPGDSNRLSVCNYLNGTMNNWGNCVLNPSNETSCRYAFPQVCSESDQSGCYSNGCYAAAADSNDCDTLAATHSSALNAYGHQYISSTGICLIRVPDVSQCLSRSLDIVTNTWFNRGSRETPQTCVGICDTRSTWGDETVTEAQCAQKKTCTKNCGDKCRSSQQKPGTCVDLYATNQNCTGFINYQGTCYYDNLNATSCATSSDRRWVTCESKTTEDSCNAHPYRDLLSCYWDRKSWCDSQAECEASGACTDNMYFNWRNQSAGVCVVDVVYDEQHRPTNCQMNDHTSWWGSYCIYLNITEPADCTAFGGIYKKQARNATECAGHGQGCRETGYWELTPKNTSLCASCGGTMQPKFSWIPGVWTQPDWIALSWIPRNWTSVNSWTQTIDDAGLSMAIDKAASMVIARAISTDYSLRYKYLSQMLYFVACDCTPDAAGRPCFAGEGMKSKEAEDKVIPGEPRQVGPATILPGTFPGNNSVQVTIESVPEFQFRGGNSPTRLKRRQATDDWTQHAVVYYNSQVAGQLIGNGISVTSSVDPTNPYELTLTIDDTIPRNPDFTVYDVGVQNAGQQTFRPLSISVVVIGTQLKANVTTQGTFAPIVRLAQLPSASTPPPPPPSATTTTTPGVSPTPKSGSARATVCSWLFLSSLIALLVLNFF